MFQKYHTIPSIFLLVLAMLTNYAILSTIATIASIMFYPHLTLHFYPNLVIFVKMQTKVGLIIRDYVSYFLTKNLEMLKRFVLSHLMIMVIHLTLVYSNGSKSHLLGLGI